MSVRSRKKDAADWTASDPMLPPGAWGFEADTGLFKVGDGVTRWNGLPYGVSGGGPYATPSDLRDLSLSPCPLGDVRIGAQTVLWLDTVDGVLYGRDGNNLLSSTDNGATSSIVANLGFSAYGVLGCADGEILVVSAATSTGGLWRSSGLATGLPTFSKVVGPSADAYFLRWGVDGDGMKFIAAEYATTAAPGWSASQKVRISTDGGQTWTVAYDTAIEFPASAGSSHHHGACYDPWQDRFFFSEGHGAPKGIYVSGDDGATWTRMTGGLADTLEPCPTVMVATGDGIVCGSDSDPNGVFGIARTEALSDLSLKLLWEWRNPDQIGGGLVGFAQRGVRDPSTGIVYIGFNSNFGTVAPVIAAGTGRNAALVWTAPDKRSGDRVYDMAFTPSGELLANYRQEGVQNTLRAAVPEPGVANELDRSGVVGGLAQQGSIAIGAGAVATGQRTVVIGTAAAMTGSEKSVYIGYGIVGTVSGAVVIGSSPTVAGNGVVAIGDAVVSQGGTSVAIGQNAETGIGANATAVGFNATITGSNSTVIGMNARATGGAAAVGQNSDAGNAGVAIGQNAECLTSGGADAAIAVAVGQLAKARTTRATALGYNARAIHDRAVALGSDALTSADRQVMVGPRHFELVEIDADAAAPAADRARLYVKDNGAGKTQLAVRFPTGDVQILATEP